MKLKLRSLVVRIVKLAISLGVFCFSCLRDLIHSWTGEPLPAKCVVLYYHSVAPEQRPRFARQMDMLLRLAKAIPADGKAPLSAGQRYVAVTFDDAFHSVMQNAVPELVIKKIPATIFVIAGIIGRSPGWEGYLERTMTLRELKELPADLITIGSHTITHPALPSISEVDAKAELMESRMKLEELLDRRISLFSFPYGAFEERLIGWCKEAGYERVFTTLPYWAFNDEKEFATGRVSAEPTDWSIEFYLKLYGAYRWLPWAFSMLRSLRQPNGNFIPSGR